MLMLHRIRFVQTRVFATPEGYSASLRLPCSFTDPHSSSMYAMGHTENRSRRFHAFFPTSLWPLPLSTSAFTSTNFSFSLELLFLLTHRSSCRSLIRLFVLKHNRRLALATAKMGSVYAWGVWWVSFPLSVFFSSSLHSVSLSVDVVDVGL